MRGMSALIAPVDRVLRDGSTVRIRPATPEDRVRVERYLIELSPESRHLRFHSPVVDVGEIAAQAVDVDPPTHVTLLALTGGDDGTVVGGAQYFRIDDTRAEVGVSVSDRVQRHGLGSLLIGQLAESARDNGITTLLAEVLPENHPMIAVFRASGFSPRIRALPGSIEVTIPTTLTEDAARHFEDRDIEAAANAVRSFLVPDVIAVIGASRDPGAIGGRLFLNLLEARFHGVVYPVNPRATAVQGVARSRAFSMSRRRSTSRSSRCRPLRWSPWHASAPTKACAPSSWSRPGSRRSEEKCRSASASSSRCAAHRGCA